jgi:hypothetical protein
VRHARFSAHLPQLASQTTASTISTVCSDNFRCISQLLQVEKSIRALSISTTVLSSSTMLRQRRIREDLVESDALPVAGERDKHQASGGKYPALGNSRIISHRAHAVVDS